MKIGLSYSRCMRDIVDGTVDIEDVLLVIARTDFDPHDDDQWKGIWIGYGGGTDMATLLASLAVAIQNGQATTTRINSVVLALNFGKQASYISLVSLEHTLAVCLTTG